MRFLVALVATLVAWFGLSQPATADGSTSTSVQTYTYGIQYQASSRADIAPERGPPLDRHTGTTTYDAGDSWSHGTVVRPDAHMGIGHTTYDPSGWLAQVDSITGTTKEPARLIDADLSSFERWQVAAKTGTSALDVLSPAVRSNVDDAVQRAAAGKVRFPGHDGKVYNNSDDLLPRGGNYTEWTAAQAGSKRGADRVIIDGDPANPSAIYYWDHVNPPARIGP